MKKYIKHASAILLGLLILTSCEDDNVNAPGKYSVADAPTSGTLKALAQAHGFRIGNTLSYSDLNNEQKLELIKKEFDNVTFGYEMKHGAIVKDDGSQDWSRADAMVVWAKNNGLAVYGHTLVWHQNQNATYLKKIAAPPVTEFLGPNIVQNANINDNIDGYAQLNPNPAGGCGSRIALVDAGRNGTKGLHIDGTCSEITADDYWRLQIRGMLKEKMVAGGTYRIEFWIKAKVAGTVQFETRDASGGDAQYKTFNATTDWSKITLEFTAKGTEDAIAFDLNNVNHTEYWIDDVSVVQILDGPPNIVQNPTINNNIDGYAQLNPNPTGGCGSRISHVEEGRNSTKGLYVDGTCSAVTADDYWRLQIRAMLYQKMQANVDYVVEFWIKSGAAGIVQIETREASGGDAQYKTVNVTTDWTKATLVFTAKGTEDAIAFDLNNANHTTYWIDDVSVKQYVAPNTGGPSDEDKAKIDNAMQTWITECVNHFKGDVHVWDVVNEPMADGKSGLRTSSNSDVDSEAKDIFFWSDFLGRDYALKAFQYAAAADPDALLFINDYNLESNPAKLDSLIVYVAELKAKGAKIDGIGTQMHISDPKSYGPIYDMFQKLAKTGLLIKISELDIKANVTGKETVTQIDLEYQAAMYQYIVKTYLELIPKEQQYGITVWGVNDGSSWLNKDDKKYFFPLLWDDNWVRKPAYNAVYKALE